MTEHPNATLVRRGYEAFNTGDIAAFAELLADDVVQHQPGDNPLAGDYEGRDAVLGFYGRLAEETAGTFRAELEQVLVNGSRVVTVHHSTATRKGRALDCRTSLLFEIRDGQAIDIDTLDEDPDAWDRFFCR
ncbi:MAG: nuclear transport factor 2 family protein [Actinomycetota bacterium]|nr:nuclear transport factor 2 family protein [Actinomycetota bacterium]